MCHLYVLLNSHPKPRTYDLIIEMFLYGPLFEILVNYKVIDYLMDFLLASHNKHKYDAECHDI